MRARLGVLFPFALVGAGCSLRPWTPSVSVAFWSEDVPNAREYTLPTSFELTQRWQVVPASTWSRYHKPTLISAVDPMGGHASLPNGFGLDFSGVVTGVAPNSLTSSDWRDDFAGTPWHKHVPAKIEPA